MKGYNLTNQEDWEEYKFFVGNLTRDFKKDNLPLLISALKRLNGLGKDERKDQLDSIIVIADDVIAKIDVEQLFQSSKIRNSSDEQGQFRARHSEALQQQVLYHMS